MNLACNTAALKVVELHIDLKKTENLCFMTFLSSERQERIRRFVHDADKLRCLWAGLLVKKVVSDITGLDVEHQKYGFTENEKPFLKNDKLKFNVSHSGNSVFVCLGYNDIGADVEEMKEAPFYIMKTIFHENEIKYIENSSADLQKNQRFYEVWTRKEAYGKYTGEGLFDEIKDVDTQNGNLNVFFKTWIRDGYCFSICTKEVSEIETLDESVRKLCDYYNSIII